jgi:hypothetical protein
VPLQAIDEFYRAVMFQHHAVRQRSDRRLVTLRQPANSQEHQILLWFKTRRARHGIAIAQESPNAIAQFSRYWSVVTGFIITAYIVSRYIRHICHPFRKDEPVGPAGHHSRQ